MSAQRDVVGACRPRPAGIVAIAALALALAACAGAPDSQRHGIGAPYVVKGTRYVPRADPHYDAVGTASWYGGRFHGRRTASGQRYDMDSMTAAHKTLPIGTRVRVTNLANQQSVELTVNDRGPFVGNRIIDVSRRAARELRFYRAGTALVRVQVIGPEGTPPAVRVAKAPGERPDAAHFIPVLNRAMEHGPRLGEFFWTDPETGHRGSIMPLTQPAEASNPFCRNYRRTVQTAGGRVSYIGRACREAVESWRIVRERRAEL